jgi:hypothetical protein
MALKFVVILKSRDGYQRDRLWAIVISAGYFVDGFCRNDFHVFSLIIDEDLEAWHAAAPVFGFNHSTSACNFFGGLVLYGLHVELPWVKVSKINVNAVRPVFLDDMGCNLGCW